jgi:hypothetical protein
MKPNAPPPSATRLCVIFLGYLIAIAGALSFLSVPLYVTFLTFIAGLGVTALGAGRDYSAQVFTWRTWLVWIAGCAVLMGVLWLIGQDRIRHWTPHPAGYQIVWLVCLTVFRHLRQILPHGPSSAHE